MARQVAADILVKNRGICVERPFGIDDRRQRLVLNVDQLERIFGEVPIRATTAATGSPTNRALSIAMQ